MSWMARLEAVGVVGGGCFVWVNECVICFMEKWQSLTICIDPSGVVLSETAKAQALEVISILVKRKDASNCECKDEGGH